MPQAEAGKGSAPRPTDQTQFANNWDLIFGKCAHGVKKSEACDACWHDKLDKNVQTK